MRQERVQRSHMSVLMVAILSVAICTCTRAASVCPNDLTQGTSRPYNPFPKPRYERLDTSSNVDSVSSAAVGAERCNPAALHRSSPCAQLNFTSSQIQGNIYFAQDKHHYFFEPAACLLRRLSAAEAASCLAASVGHPVLFVGDSVTRYQYLAFLHWLVSGRYQDPYDGQGSLTNAYRHNLTADVYRSFWKIAEHQIRKHNSGARLETVVDRSNHIERARFRMPDPSSGQTVKLDYYYVSRATEEEVAGALQWALQKHRRLSHVILGVCAHYKNDSAALLSDLHDSLPYAVQHLYGLGSKYGNSSAGSTTVVWKSCTVPHTSAQDRQAWQRASEEAHDLAWSVGAGVYDARALVRAAMDQRLGITWNPSEAVHLMQWCYGELNDLLLNYLCPVPPATSEQQQQQQQAKRKYRQHRQRKVHLQQ